MEILKKFIRFDMMTPEKNRSFKMNYKKRLSLNIAIEKYIKFCIKSGGFSEETIKGKIKHAKRLKRDFLKRPYYIQLLKYSDIEEIKEELSESLSGNVINTCYLSLISQTLAYFKRLEIIKEVPEIVRCKTVKKEVEFLNVKQFQYLRALVSIRRSKYLKHMRDDNLYWTISILFYSGLRIRELRALKWEDVKLNKENPKESYITIGDTAFNKKGRIIPISSFLYNVLSSMPKFDDKFVDPYFHYSKTTFPKDLRRVKEKHKINFNLRPTIFRPSFATAMASIEGVSPYAVQSYLGHKNAQTTLSYVNIKSVLKNSSLIEKLDLNFLKTA